MAPSPSSSSSPSTHPILPVMRKLSNSTKYRQDQSRTSLPTKPELRRSTWPVTVDQARSLRKTRHPRKRRTPGLALMHIRYRRYACPCRGSATWLVRSSTGGVSGASQRVVFTHHLDRVDTFKREVAEWQQEESG